MSDPDASADGGAAAIPTTTAAGTDAARRPAGCPRRRPGAAGGRRVWPWVVVGLVALILVGGWIASRISVNYYVITPGDATPVSQYIEVPAADAHPLTGTILLTDVFVTQLDALDYLRYRYFDSDSEVISGPELLGPTVNEDQYLTQGYLEMAQAQSFATATALTHLGYAVTSTNAGALVYGIEPNSPAAKTLKVAQVITGLNGHATPTDCALDRGPARADARDERHARRRAVLHQRRRGLRAGPVVQKAVTLGTPPKGLVETGCGAPTRPRPTWASTPRPSRTGTSRST